MSFSPIILPVGTVADSEGATPSVIIVSVVLIVFCVEPVRLQYLNGWVAVVFFAICLKN